MLDVERYYRVLDLEPGASPEEVYQGYLDMTWVWHPDRFVGHPRLQKKAHHKLQQLNEAREKLRSSGVKRCQNHRYSSSKSNIPSPQPSRASANGLYKPPRQTQSQNPKRRSIQMNTQPQRFNSRDVGEWLD